MSGQPPSMEPRAGVAEFRQRLLAGLGLRADATDQDVESAHNGLLEFLELAPHDLKLWAAAQTANLDEAFALLSGPERDQIQAMPVGPSAPEGLDEIAPVRLDEPLRKKVAWAAVPLLVIAVVLGVYLSGKTSGAPGISGTPTSQQSTAAAGAKTTVIDQAKVAALMKKVSTNHKDVASLQALGDIYFAAADYKTAAIWERTVLGVDPKNKMALISIGAAQFNSGSKADAKKSWLVAAGLYPEEAEVHYDLGFLYFSQTPPDKAKMTAEWKKVVAIDPNSSRAKAVATHLTSATSAPTGSATPSNQITP